MIGTVTLKSFDARPLGQTGKGIQVEGTVTLQIPFSAQLQTLPSKVTECSEKQIYKHLVMVTHQKFLKEDKA